MKLVLQRSGVDFDRASHAGLQMIVNLCRRRLDANRDSHCHTSRLKQIAFPSNANGASGSMTLGVRFSLTSSVIASEAQNSPRSAVFLIRYNGGASSAEHQPEQ